MRISNSAKFFPAQMVGPTEKGMKASVLRIYISWEWKILGSKASRCSWGSQRSGKNSSGSGEKYRGSRCMEYVCMKALVPSGMKLVKSPEYSKVA